MVINIMYTDFDFEGYSVSLKLLETFILGS